MEESKQDQLIDIENSTYEQLLDEFEKCQRQWGKYSSDDFGYYITALHKKIVSLGGWPPRQ